MTKLVESSLGGLESTNTIDFKIEIIDKADVSSLIAVDVSPLIVLEEVKNQTELEQGFSLASEYRCKRLHFRPNDKEIPDFDFKNLPYINQLKSIHIDLYWSKKTSLNLIPNDFQILENLIDLKFMSQYSVNFNQYLKFPNLKSLNVRFHKKQSAWLEHEGIIDLTIQKFKGDDLAALSNMKSLKRLKLVQGSVKSLKGIENLKNLETLHIHSVRNLTDLSALLESTSIENIIFDAYSKVTDWDFLAEMKQLKLIRLKEAQSIQFLNELPNVRFAVITKIQDKDDSPKKKIYEQIESSTLSSEQHSKAFGRLVDVYS